MNNAQLIQTRKRSLNQTHTVRVQRSNSIIYKYTKESKIMTRALKKGGSVCGMVIFFGLIGLQTCELYNV